MRRSSFGQDLWRAKSDVEARTYNKILGTYKVPKPFERHDHRSASRCPTIRIQELLGGPNIGT
jgi:hypothetical protein